MALPTQPQINERFDTATEEEVPHYNWIPPEWTGASKPKFEDTVSAEKLKFPEPNLNCVALLEDRITALREKFPGHLDKVRAKRSLEERADSDETLQQMSHPDSNFRHVDKNVYSETERQRFLDASDLLENLRELARRDGELAGAAQEMVGPVRRVRALLAQNPSGMRRLKLVFEWTLCQTITLLGELNAAKTKEEYNRARCSYIELLKDLDDHEPHTKKDKPKCGERGYGCTIKWFYVFPLIQEGKVKGVKVVAKWNPHISSSGAPIPH